VTTLREPDARLREPRTGTVISASVAATDRSFTVERAAPDDAEAISALLARAAPETIALDAHAVRARHGRFVIVRDDEEVVAVTALHPLDDDALEVRSVAVAPTHRGSGLGRRVVRAALDSPTARRKHVWCYTFRPGFFASLGFESAAVEDAPMPARPGRPRRLDGRERRAMHRPPREVSL